MAETTAYEKLTRTNDAIRSLTGSTDKLTLDDMYTNLESVVEEVVAQSALIDQITTALEDKVAGSGNIPTSNITFENYGYYNGEGTTLFDIYYSLPDLNEVTRTVIVTGPSSGGSQIITAPVGSLLYINLQTDYISAVSSRWIDSIEFSQSDYIKKTGTTKDLGNTYPQIIQVPPTDSTITIQIIDNDD